MGLVRTRSSALHVCKPGGHNYITASAHVTHLFSRAHTPISILCSHSQTCQTRPWLAPYLFWSSQCEEVSVPVCGYSRCEEVSVPLV